MAQLSLTLAIKLAREELDNALESVYCSGYYLYLKKPSNYYRLLLYAIAKVQQLSKTKLPYNSLELRLTTEKYLKELISCLLPTITVQKQPTKQLDLLLR